MNDYQFKHQPRKEGKREIIIWVIIVGIVGWMLAISFVTAFYYKSGSNNPEFFQIALDWGYQF